MQPLQWGGLVRTTKSRAEIEDATRMAFERKHEGYSPEALVMALNDVLNDEALSRAIVLFVQSDSEQKGRNVERPSSWMLALISISFAVSCSWLVFYFFTLVNPKTDFLSGLLLVFAQFFLLKLAWRGLRQALITACDGLNESSYPTNLHPATNASATFGSLRFRRLRALVNDTADRIVAGEKPRALVDDLAAVNLTKAAARVMVSAAAVSAASRDYIPPYKSPWLGYSMAVIFMVTCVGFFEFAGDRISDGFQNYAAVIAGWIGASLSARPRKPRTPQEFRV